LRKAKSHLEAAAVLKMATEFKEQFHAWDDRTIRVKQEKIDDQVGRCIAYGLSKCRKLKMGNIPFSSLF